MSAELVLLMIATTGASVAALFAILAFLRAQQLPDALTAQGATQILRAETDIVRAAVEDQARGLRQELGHSLKGFQELTLAGFGTHRMTRPGQQVRRCCTQPHRPARWT